MIQFTPNSIGAKTYANASKMPNANAVSVTNSQKNPGNKQTKGPLGKRDITRGQSELQCCNFYNMQLTFYAPRLMNIHVPYKNYDIIKILIFLSFKGNLVQFGYTE